MELEYDDCNDLDQKKKTLFKWWRERCKKRMTALSNTPVQLQH